MPALLTAAADEGLHARARQASVIRQFLTGSRGRVQILGLPANFVVGALRRVRRVCRPSAARTA